MVTEGSLFGFGDFLQVLSDRRKTGRLTVHAPAVEGIILYDRKTGRLSEGAPSSEGVLFLDTGRLIGMIGHDGEVVMPSNSDDGVVRWPEAAVEFLESLLRATRLGFAFEPGVRWRGGPPAPEGSVHAAVQKRVRVEQWSSVATVIPSLLVRPTLVAQTSGDVTLDRQDWRVLKGINGRRTVSGLAQATGMTQVFTCERLMNLFRRDLVELNLPAPGTTTESVVEASQPSTPSPHVVSAGGRSWFRPAVRQRPKD